MLTAARSLRQNLRPDFTVARFGDSVLAVLAEHDFGDGEPVAEANGLRNRIASTAPGTQVTVTVLRDGSRTDLPVTLDEYSPG